eukprot:7943646-Alexandrium_andersonii.AAC.1
MVTWGFLMHSFQQLLKEAFDSAGQTGLVPAPATPQELRPTPIGELQGEAAALHARLTGAAPVGATP